MELALLGDQREGESGHDIAAAIAAAWTEADGGHKALLSEIFADDLRERLNRRPPPAPCSPVEDANPMLMRARLSSAWRTRGLPRKSNLVVMRGQWTQKWESRGGSAAKKETLTRRCPDLVLPTAVVAFSRSSMYASSSRTMYAGSSEPVARESAPGFSG
nr:unnamed protein product [Digitaria exilis]